MKLIVYTIIQEKLLCKADHNKIIERNKLKSMLGFIFRIPKSKRTIVIEELKELNLIKEIDLFKFKII